MHISHSKLEGAALWKLVEFAEAEVRSILFCLSHFQIGKRTPTAFFLLHISPTYHGPPRMPSSMTASWRILSTILLCMGSPVMQLIECLTWQLLVYIGDFETLRGGECVLNAPWLHAQNPSQHKKPQQLKRPSVIGHVATVMMLHRCISLFILF